MITKAGWPMLLLSVVFFLGSFAGTVATRSQAPTTEPAADSAPIPLACWLELSEEQTQALGKVDPSFVDERWSLQRSLDQARTKLALLFEDKGVSDGALREQVELVIAAHNALERRVAEHLIAVRPHLAPGHQKTLFCLCAERVRQGRGRCWAQDAGGPSTGGKGCGSGCGLRPGKGDGPRCGDAAGAGQRPVGGSDR